VVDDPVAVEKHRKRRRIERRHAHVHARAAGREFDALDAGVGLDGDLVAGGMAAAARKPH